MTLPEPLLQLPPQKLFPSVLIILDFAAAAVYGYQGGWAAWRSIVYWTAAGVLTYTVTW